MWELQSLTTLWVSTASYRDSFSYDFVFLADYFLQLFHKNLIFNCLLTHCVTYPARLICLDVTVLTIFATALYSYTTDLLYLNVTLRA
jgi:hypothetical protein